MKLLTVNEAAKKTRMSVSWWRKEIMEESVTVCRIGCRVFIPESTIDEMMKISIVASKKIKPYEETHQKGSLLMDWLPSSKRECDFGIQIAEDGRVWVCVDGQSVMRFSPLTLEYKNEKA